MCSAGRMIRIYGDLVFNNTPSTGSGFKNHPKMVKKVPEGRLA